MREHLAAMHKKPLVDCSESDCDKQLASEWAMQRHVKSDHLRIRFDCLLQDCTRHFNSEAARSFHKKTDHEGRRFDCPYPDCNKQFTRKSDMRIHVDSFHLGKRYECPLDDCDRQFMQEAYVKELFKRVHPGRELDGRGELTFPCPLADQEGCEKLFVTVRLATRHANVAHSGTFPCPYTNEISCEKMFATKAQADIHGRNTHVRYLCSVPMCENAIMRRSVLSTEIARHMELHERFGLFARMSAQPEPVKILPGETRREESYTTSGMRAMISGIYESRFGQEDKNVNDEHQGCRDNGAEDEDSRHDLEHDEDGNDDEDACGEATDAICNLEVEGLPLCSATFVSEIVNVDAQKSLLRERNQKVLKRGYSWAFSPRADH